MQKMAAPTLRYLLIFFHLFVFSLLRVTYLIAFKGKDPADYKRVKRCFIFKCSNCTLQNIENVLPSEADANSLISDENSVSCEVKPTTEKVYSSPSQRPSTLFPQQFPLSTPLIFVPPAMISPLSPIFAPLP